MKYKVEIVLLLPSESKGDAEKLLKEAQKLINKAGIINEGAPNEDVSTITLEEHYHESPTQPCVLLYDWDKKNGEKVK